MIKYPPEIYEKENNKLTIFLAGTIEMGNSEDWQSFIADHFKDHENIVFLNPRRTDWDSSWEQKIENENFRAQVEWELAGLEQADLIVMYLDPKTKSPISMLELGLYIKKRIIVCCPDGFWRKGNIDIVCKKWAVPVVDNLADIINEIDLAYASRFCKDWKGIDCPYCNDKAYINSSLENINYKNENINLKLIFLACSSCKEEFTTTEIDNINFKYLKLKHEIFTRKNV